MHGLINRSLQCFVRDTYGTECWTDVASKAGLGFDSFEAMLVYDDTLTVSVIDSISAVLGKTRDAVLEDLGIYLVSHPNVASLRRLLRFGGETFIEFLHSLDDLHDRGKLAVPDLELPHLELREHAAGTFSLACRWTTPDFGHVVVGMLRAMADDYGALALLEHQGGQGNTDTISIDVLETGFSEGRSFALSANAL